MPAKKVTTEKVEEQEVKTPAKKTTTAKKATTAAKKPAAKKPAETKAVEKKAPAKVEKQEKPTATSAVAISKGISVTPRKARLVVDLVRGKSVEEAYNILNNLNKAASTSVYKTIKSAASNAVHNYHMNQALLYVDTIYANDGPRLKRYLPRAKGSASGLVKRWCSITVIVKEREVK